MAVQEKYEPGDQSCGSICNFSCGSKRNMNDGCPKSQQWCRSLLGWKLPISLGGLGQGLLGGGTQPVHVNVHQLRPRQELEDHGQTGGIYLQQRLRESAGDGGTCSV